MNAKFVLRSPGRHPHPQRVSSANLNYAGIEFPILLQDSPAGTPECAHSSNGKTMPPMFSTRFLILPSRGR
jgi:hypothetical protein